MTHSPILMKANMIRIIIAGGRDYTNYPELKGFCKAVVDLYKNDVEIVSGTMKGVDLLGERFSREVIGSEPARFPADWDDINHPEAVVKYKKNGKPYNAAAGPIRNRKMADYADMLIAFWDKKSRGTKNMIEEAEKRGLLVHINYY